MAPGWADFRASCAALLAPVFAQARSRLAAFAYIGALLAEPGDRRSCWQLAERAGHATPRRMQALLAEHAWDWTAALAALQRFILARLGDPEAIVVLDETAELKKGDRTVGVARQHAGITGQVENCQTVVFAAYVTARAHALFDFRLYLPKSVVRGRAAAGAGARPGRRGVRHQAGAGHRDDHRSGRTRGVPFAWVAGDEVYGRSGKLREACEKDKKGYVVAVPVNFTVTLPSGRKTAVAAVARLVPATAWETRSCGRGCKGHRDYAWAWAATASPRHWVLIRRSLTDPSDLAFFYCHAPQGRPVTLPALVTVAGKRWPAEECHQQGKGQTGLDQHQVRTWPSFCRHTVLSMCAQALLAIAAAPARPRSAAESPPPGLVKVSVPRSPPPPPAGRHADEPRRPRPRLRLVTTATTPPGPRPMAPLPRPAQSRPPHLTIARRKGSSCNKPGL